MALIGCPGLMGVDVGGIVGLIVSVIVGAGLAVAAGFGLVSSQSATPAPVEAPYIVYGEA